MIREERAERKGYSQAFSEGCAEVLDRGFTGLVEGDRGDVEAHALEAPVAREALTPQPFTGDPHPGALAPVDAVERAHEGSRTAGADLDDDDDSTLAEEEIDLEPADA